MESLKNAYFTLCANKKVWSIMPTDLEGRLSPMCTSMCSDAHIETSQYTLAGADFAPI